MNVTIDFATQIQKKVLHLSEERQHLILQLIESYLTEEDWSDDELSENDLMHIEIARKELQEGRTAPLNEIAWD